MMTIAIATTAACAVALAMRSRAGSGQILAALFGTGRGTTVLAPVFVRAWDDQLAARIGRDVAPTTGVVPADLMDPPG